MMKKSFSRFCLSLLIFSLFNINLLAQEPVKITLDQALEIALAESNTVKIADMTVEKSGYAKKGSYAALYPNVSVSSSYQRTLLKQVMVMDMGGQPMEIKVGRDNNISASASASMPLVNAQLGTCCGTGSLLQSVNDFTGQTSFLWCVACQGFAGGDDPGA